MPFLNTITPARTRGRILTAAAGLLAAAALTLGGPAASAHAALIATGACDASALSKPFAQWGDNATYKLIPGGDFEGSLSGWTLGGGATVTAGGAESSDHALTLKPGASVQTPATCVNTSYPTFRVFAKTQSGLATALVQIVYNLPVLGPVALPVGVVTLNGAWSPSLTMLTAATVPGLLSNGTAQAALRFTELTGTTAVDGIYVDPRMR
jgi:hypothetical protein